jgi:phosphoribosylglycinamide formyltransferase 1
MSKKTRLGFLASHRGSNMQTVIDACHDGRLPAVPAVVISNNRDSNALSRAHMQDIPAVHLSAAVVADADELDQRIVETLRKHGVDLVVLAGYMKKIGPNLLAAYRNRIVNIHPSLLPRHGGPGMYGEHVHAAVLAAGDRETGVTVHLVNEDYDQGAMLACRGGIPVLPDDTPASLAARVLEVEHEFLVETLGRILAGEIRLPETGQENHHEGHEELKADPDSSSGSS